MMPHIPVLDSAAWTERLLALRSSERAGVLAYYDHRLQAIVQTPSCALVPVDDHLVHRGDGVFETLAFRDRGIVNLDAHLARLRSSLDGLSITLPCSWDVLRAILIAVARAAGRADGMLRILVGRGQGGFGLDPAECREAGLYVVAYAAEEGPEVAFPDGATACRSAVPVKPGMLARIKTTNYLPNVLMVLEARKRGVDFTFGFDDQGFLAESAIANVALVDAAGAFVLPEFSHALTGTTAQKAADLAAGFVPVRRERVPEDSLFQAREIMILGTSYGCVSVVEYEGCPVASGRPGPVAARLREMLRTSLRQERVVF